MTTKETMSEAVYDSRQKYYSLYKSLKKDIENNVYGTSNKLPNEIDLAEQYHVSRPTVAKALSLLQKSGYIQRVSGVGTFVRYEPNIGTKNFALLIPGLGETEIFESICGHISHLSQLKNFNLVWSGSMQEDAEMRRQHIKQLAVRYIKQKDINGVFFTPLELTSEKDTINSNIVQLFDEAGIPVVLMDRDIVSFPSRSQYDLVGVDNFRLAYILTRHLIEQGCQKVMFVARPYSAPTVQMRIFGYQRALKDAGIQDTPKDIHVEEITSPNFIDNFISNVHQPGILCANDTTASKVMYYIEEHGYKIPDDVKIAGVDDMKYAEYLRVPLTTYKQPCKDIAEAAIDLMLSRIQDAPKKARTILINGELIVRKSTARL